MLRAAVGDLRALGRWAPVRVAHELARRSGATAFFPRRAATRAAPPMRLVRPSWAPGADAADWPGEADRILDEGVAIFGRRVTAEPAPDWHADERGGRWPEVPWWKVDIYEDERRDVKHVWELGRHQYLTVLARAAASSENSRYEQALVRHLTSWVEANPPGTGVHWHSNLEIALRVVSWLEILDVAGASLPAPLREEMVRHLYYSGSHLMADLPLTLSSSRNNHLIGDGLGLILLGSIFPTDRRAGRWGRVGRRLLTSHTARHVRSDGSSIEDAVGYRGFVAQLLAVAAHRDLDAVDGALTRLAHHFHRAGFADGPVPRFGDWDDGIVVTEPPGREMPGAALLTVRRAPGTRAAAQVVTDGADAGGGLGRIERDDWLVFLKADGGDSHQHSDLLSVSIARNGRWIVGDPGNGSYNRDVEVRDYFRTSVAHNVLRVAGTDQRVPHRRFRWRYEPSGILEPPMDAGPYRVMWGTHDAYLRLDPPIAVLRACLVGPDAVVVADWLVGGPSTWELSIPLHPDIEHAGTGANVTLMPDDGGALALSLPGACSAARGSHQPFDGWWADGYDQIRPATRLQIAGESAGPVAWSVSAGDAPQVVAEERTLVVDEIRLALRSEPDGRTSLVVER